MLTSVLVPMIICGYYMRKKPSNFNPEAKAIVRSFFISPVSCLVLNLLCPTLYFFIECFGINSIDEMFSEENRTLWLTVMTVQIIVLLSASYFLYQANQIKQKIHAHLTRSVLNQIAAIGLNA